MRRALVAVVVAACCGCSPRGPEDVPAPPTRAGVAVRHERSVEVPADLVGAPFVLRCDGSDPHRGCFLVARVQKKGGRIERLSEGDAWALTRPVLVDERAAYWPGQAVLKEGLTPVTLAWRSGLVRSLEQDETHLVVVDEGGVYLLPKSGDDRVEVAPAGDGIWSAASGRGFVAYTVDGGSGPGKVVLVGRDGRPSISVEPEPAPHGVWVDEDTLYWFGFGSADPSHPTGTLRRLSNGVAETLAAGLLVPRDLCVFGEHVYWVTDEPAGRVVRRVPKAGGAVEPLGVSHELHGLRTNHDRIVVHGEHVYWNAAHSVVRVPLEGGRVELVVTADIPGDIQSFAVDDTHLYVAARIHPTRR